MMIGQSEAVEMIPFSGLEAAVESDADQLVMPRHGTDSSAVGSAGWPRGHVVGVPVARSICLVGTYPPTACGIATFTSNLGLAVTGGGSGWTAGVVCVEDRRRARNTDGVVEQFVAGNPASMRRSLTALNQFEAVVLQHEYGIYGGDDGSEVLGLVDGLEVPLVAVLHTALPDPSRHQREVLQRLVERAAAVVVQSDAACQRIVAVHQVDPDDIVVIPHGATANFCGPAASDVARPAVLTWGLLSPGKGIEHGIAAIARIRGSAQVPSYVVAGQTHPKVRAQSGEAYRKTLAAQAISLGVGDRVHFDSSYRDWVSLRALVRGVDVVLLPYESRDQVSSGVLVEALASGKPVVATRFPHAVELLDSGAGILVDHGDVAAMADALRRILYEPGLAGRMSGSARRMAAPLLWPQVGACYRQLVERVVTTRLAA